MEKDVDIVDGYEIFTKEPTLLIVIVLSRVGVE